MNNNIYISQSFLSLKGTNQKIKFKEIIIIFMSIYNYIIIIKSLKIRKYKFLIDDSFHFLIKTTEVSY